MEVGGQLNAPAALAPGKESLIPIRAPELVQPVTQSYTTELSRVLWLVHKRLAL